MDTAVEDAGSEASGLYLDPHRRKVAGLVRAARGAVDSGGLKPFRQRGIEQRVIDADPGVALE